MDGAAHFAAQLPVTWRGLFYDGWQPARVPVKYDVEQFLITVAQDSGTSVAEARRAAAAVTAALEALTSLDLIGRLLTQLPGAPGRGLEPNGQQRAEPAQEEPPRGPESGTSSSGDTVEPPIDARIERLEGDVQILAEALGAFVEGLDERPSSEPEPTRRATAARRAHQILLTRTRRG